MRVTKRCTPVPSSDRQDAQLGNDDGGTDGSRYFLGGLDAETDVAFGVANDDNGLEPRTLTGAGLFLDGLDLRSSKKRVSSLDFQYHSRLDSRGRSLTFITSSFNLGRKKSTI